MYKLGITSLLLSLVLLGTQLPHTLVESKALLCRPSPKWTVNNGTVDPMKESFGNVTLVTLIDVSYRFGLKQASSLENMLRFLKKSGLKDIHFILINSKDIDAKQKLKDVTQKVSFGVYQENESDLIWSALDGGKDDMFIYDRCGLLTYYIPFPLSIIHAQQPILQAALLSTYFDNPCGESCDSLGAEAILSNTTSIITDSLNITTTESSLSSRTDPMTTTTLNMTFDDTFPVGLNESQAFESNATSIDLSEDNVIVLETTETSDGSIGEDFSGSGSGDSPIEQTPQVSTQTNNSSLNGNREEDEWKILDFFKSDDNRSDKEIFEEIYNKSIAELDPISKTDTKPVETLNETQTTTEAIEVPLNVSNASAITSEPPVGLSIGSKNPLRTKISFFNSASRAKCETFNQSMCMEWSTDRLLRARLCCLTDVLAYEDSGFGCGHFERSKCNRMLPLIKCCLKDFSQLLDNYFQTIRVTPRPLRQKFR
ncbi:unnamed protein product [Medioppia subpectinata]|uniref:Selenoprotein P N-terminal domain-containing protein n=1 Tax=Medioppia subpectinata TaxID=1979941 RepID=A0A7R9KKK3_9ACAR|nr:unnamed protein product [Medioppia subpectinata]CAG2105446.1 unnamed protein product [Medioppia subpectinata]